MKLFLENFQSPGDILLITSCIRDLKTAYPDFKINVSTSANELWNNNPLLDRSVTRLNCDKAMRLEYPLIHTSNTGQHHFIHGFRLFLEEQLKIKIPAGKMKVDIYLSEQEKNDVTWIKQMTGMEKGYWLVNAGYKSDFTNKSWEFSRFQEVVNATSKDITWIQIGAGNHNHKGLTNVVNLIGRTNHREFIKLMYRSAGVITPVSYPMHLATIDMFGEGVRQRPCVVIAGGREPSVWEAYTNHQFIHTCGSLRCCDNGGCWKARIEKLEDGSDKDNSLCLKPVKGQSGQTIPMCLDMITSQDVIRKIENYLRYDKS